MLITCVSTIRADIIPQWWPEETWDAAGGVAMKLTRRATGQRTPNAGIANPACAARCDAISPSAAGITFSRRCISCNTNTATCPEWALQVVGWHLARAGLRDLWSGHLLLRIASRPAQARATSSCVPVLACWQLGSEELLNEVLQQPDPDDVCNVTTTACAFMCGLAPAVRINGRLARPRRRRSDWTSIIENAAV